MSIQPLRGVRVLDLTNVLAGPVLLPSARAHGRRRHQGRSARQRRPGAPARRRRRAQPPQHGRLVPRPEPGQAIDHRQLQARARQGGVSQAGAHGRRGGRELPPRRDGATRPRLPDAAGGQPEAHLLRDLRLRPGRPAARPAGVRPDHPGHVGRHEHHRRPENGAAARRLSGGRHDRRHHRGLRHCGRAGRPRSHGRLLHRRVDARGGDGDDGLGRVELPRRRARARADGQRQRHGEPVGHLPHRRRPAQHRRQQAGAVRGGVPGRRAQRADHRPALHRAPGAAAAPLRAEGAARRRDGREVGRRMVAPLQRRRRAGGPGVQRAAGAGPSADPRARHDRDVRERAGRRARHPRRAHRLQAQRQGAGGRHAAADPRRAHRRDPGRARLWQRRDRRAERGEAPI